MSEPRWLTDAEQSMWRGFQSMQITLGRALEQQLGESGLSGADFEVLVPLSEAEGHRMRARDLGRQMKWDRSRLSHQIRRMESRGLISRSNCPTDARGTFIELTEQGWATIVAAAPSHVATVRSLFVDVLDDADVTALTAITTKVNERLAADPNVEAACSGED
ncbi:MarR family winged helix-turn-helix transcriptional regulator [Jatrophihabitans telluris]|uniref:MarR family winged helix-turn-helix transcriptional regulator n=1 Tax=Jatrophihabitans telluris TaxID=2038343 RepID=A0ABY4QZS3_9ACTN|nr:MarR family winged helix-turn-helix transcriptional regulator [Jatrophihabitans telluris]UQX89156.1 MarR family winged helix-turn-helix transcriptional regulator [Jatrophihabitans telluris]